MTYQEVFEVKTKKGIDVIDITQGIKDVLKNAKISTGLCNIFLTATTACLVINENERMLQEDIKKFFRDIINEERIYHHPSNAFSHMRANLCDKELTIPVRNGELVLGTWQSIMLMEFDVEPRTRRIVVTVSGE